MVALLVHLPAVAKDANPIKGRRDREALALSDGEDLEWSDPELVA